MASGEFSPVFGHGLTALAPGMFGAHSRAMVAENIMTRNPMSIGPTEPLQRVEGLLLELDVRHLPVIDDGQLVGIISDRDVAPFRDNDEVEGAPATAADIMSSDVVSVAPETELSDVVATMIDERVGALPVVDQSTQSLVGIISYVDLLRANRDSL